MTYFGEILMANFVLNKVGQNLFVIELLILIVVGILELILVRV